MLARNERNPSAVPAPSTLAEERPVGIPYEDHFLTGSLAAPKSPRGIVVIANARGYARHVPALRALARELRSGGFATLMVDVVAPDEERIAARPDLIAGRLDAARTWLEGSGLTGLPLVLLGMGTAAAAALLSAAAKPARVRAVVACGPRPDTAGIALRMVSAPALLIAHTGQFSDINAHLRTLARLEVQRDLIVLQDSGDPVDGAVDVARATVRFLDFLGSSASKAA